MIKCVFLLLCYLIFYCFTGFVVFCCVSVVMLLYDLLALCFEICCVFVVMFNYFCCAFLVVICIFYA